MADVKIKDGYYKIRPAGRHIITIGRELIKDKYGAIVELVKNSYDADSPVCKVSLSPVEIEGKRCIKIVIKDDGHGMSFDTVVDKWMVPSTSDKLSRVKSPLGRLMQGKKGIGRYSASVLGNDLVLQTIDESGELTTLYLIWDHFENATYLEDVNVLIENFSSNRKSGTEIIIVGDEDHLNDWTIKQIQNLKFELKKLIPPVDKSDGEFITEVDDFKIQLELGNFGFPEPFSNTIESIEPYPLFELFDYRISGTVSKEGVANLKFENKRINNEHKELITNFKINLNQNPNRRSDESYCGEVKVDFRVFDRDPGSIEGLIERGLKDPISGEYVGRRQARLILDTFNGVGVYRNGFRLRPLGDAGYDWLELDRERVQNPSKKVGSDQVIGFIQVQSEVESGLEEKSARDGLKENQQYFGLQEICKQVLVQLEDRRFIYRQEVGLGRKNRDLNSKINNLYNFSDLKEKINSQLNIIGIDSQKKDIINKIISEKEEKNNKIADELKQAIALYQGQATVGKIVNVVLHEGRKPLSYFKNQIEYISDLVADLREDFTDSTLAKVVEKLEGIKEQTNIFVNLFEKLDPLAAKRRGPKKDFPIRKVIETVRDVFSSQLNSQEISYIIDCDINLTCFGWKEDFYIAFTNLVDNSLYWLRGKNNIKKEISYKVFEEEGQLIIEYRDNGPGIAKHLIESEVIFEPEFSGKTGGGTGLGLAIAGEAINRNGGELKAIYSEKGAFFKIELKIE